MFDTVDFVHLIIPLKLKPTSFFFLLRHCQASATGMLNVKKGKGKKDEKGAVKERRRSSDASKA